MRYHPADTVGEKNNYPAGERATELLANALFLFSFYALPTSYNTLSEKIQPWEGGLRIEISLNKKHMEFPGVN